MSKALYCIPFCILPIAVACSTNVADVPQPNSVEEAQSTTLEPSDSSAMLHRRTADSGSETISLAPEAAHDPQAFGPAPPERTALNPIRDWVYDDGLDSRVALFDSVFWDPRDTVSLRELIAETDLVKGKKVLEIGTGSGLVSLYCLKFGASSVVATDINPLAVMNARYNAQRMGLADRFDVRLVSLDDPGAYSVIDASEKFDLLISNPPWEDAKPERIADFAYYDPGFALLRSMMGGLDEHLHADGKALLAYGCVDGIQHVQKVAKSHDFRTQILDERQLDDMPAVFVPGMLIEVALQNAAEKEGEEE